MTTLGGPIPPHWFLVNPTNPDVFGRADGARVERLESGWYCTGVGGARMTQPEGKNGSELMQWLNAITPGYADSSLPEAMKGLTESLVAPAAPADPADPAVPVVEPIPAGWAVRSHNQYRRLDGVRIRRRTVGADWRWTIFEVPGLVSAPAKWSAFKVMSMVDDFLPLRSDMVVDVPAVREASSPTPVDDKIMAPADDFPPIPDKEDPEQEIAKAIAEDAARMLERLAKMLRAGENAGRALRITGAYIEANREVVKMLGLPEAEGRKRRVLHRRGRYGQRYEPDFGDDDENNGPFQGVQAGGLIVGRPDDDEDGEDEEVLAHPRRGRGHGRAQGDPQDQMMGMLAEANRTQQIQALSIALRNAERGNDPEMTERIRAELNLLLPGGERRAEGERRGRGRRAPADPAATFRGPPGSAAVAVVAADPMVPPNPTNPGDEDDEDGPFQADDAMAREIAERVSQTAAEDDELDADNEALPLGGQATAAATGFQQGRIERALPGVPVGVRPIAPGPVPGILRAR